MPISATLSRVLRSGRPQFNKKVGEARSRFPAFDTDAFACFLEQHVDPVVLAVDAVKPERTAAVTVAAFDAALDLVGHGLASGGRAPLMAKLWQDMLPTCAGQVGDQPGLVAQLCNAIAYLANAADARPSQWLEGMERLGRRAGNPSQLLALGQLLAWRAGLPHLRIGAIAAGDILEPALALAAIRADTAGAWPEIRARLLSDRWWRPEADGAHDPAPVEIGRFTGFGGSFREPPQVRACTEGFVVRSAERYHFLLADAFGAALLAASEEEWDQALSGGVRPKADGSRLRVGTRWLELDLPPGQFSAIANADTVAITSPLSHAIRLLPAC